MSWATAGRLLGVVVRMTLWLKAKPSARARIETVADTFQAKFEGVATREIAVVRMQCEEFVSGTATTQRYHTMIESLLALLESIVGHLTITEPRNVSRARQVSALHLQMAKIQADTAALFATVSAMLQE